MKKPRIRLLTRGGQDANRDADALPQTGGLPQHRISHCRAEATTLDTELVCHFESSLKMSDRRRAGIPWRRQLPSGLLATPQSPPLIQWICDLLCCDEVVSIGEG